MLCEEDSDDILPQATDGNPGQGLAGGWTFYSTFGGAEAGRFDVKQGAIYSYTKEAKIFESSGDPDAKTSGNSFAFNGALTTWTGTGLNPSTSSTAIDAPANTMLLGEEGCGGPSLVGYGYSRGTTDGYFNPGTDHFSKFHPGGSVVAFCDGHVKILQAEDHFVETICGSAVQCFH